MRILLISDLHGNLDALTAIREPHDQVWVLGDLVNYGPQPKEIIRWVREQAAHVEAQPIGLARLVGHRRLVAPWEFERTF